MLRAEVFGAWPAGSEPMLGLSGKPTLEGLELAALDADSAAAKAGLQAGDRVTRIDAKPVVGPDDVQLALAEKDAGQEVTLEISRAGAARQVKALLAPRTPCVSPFAPRMCAVLARRERRQCKNARLSHCQATPRVITLREEERKIARGAMPLQGCV